MTEGVSDEVSDALLEGVILLVGVIEGVSVLLGVPLTLSVDVGVTEGHPICGSPSTV